jgi:hypothetical protein
MKAPNTRMELAAAIESLIGSYMDGIREAAKEAVERAMRSTVTVGHARRRKEWAAGPAARMSRRAPTRVDELCNKLCEVIRANPGASMVVIAEKVGAKSTDLQWPMTKCKRAGRVRSVGQRSLTRYYPAVLRAPNKD